MVPLPENSYFASLDKCLNGDIQLISWKALFRSIQTRQRCNHEDAIDRFLADKTVTELLENPFTAFPPPSQQSKSTFETKTSAINVTPSSSARFDIKEVKEDALWLSKEAQIDEISALRVTVIECQDRTFAQLLGPLSTEELSSIQDAAGSSQASVPVALLSQGSDAETLQKQFDLQDNRRVRLLRTYLSERLFFIKFWAYFFQDTLYLHALQASNGENQGKVPSLYPKDEVSQAWARAVEQPDQTLLKSITAIGRHIESIQDGSGWYKEDGGREDLESEWTNTHITISTHIMEVMFQIIDVSPKVASSKVMLAWLELIHNWKFFQLNSENLVSQNLSLHLQAIASVVAMSLLDSSTCIEHLQDIDTVAKSYDSEDAPYITNTATIQKIHEYTIGFANELFLWAGPMVLTWSTILGALRERVLAMKSIEEAIEEEGYSGRLSPSNHQIPDSHDMYEAILEDILRNSSSTLIEGLASNALDENKTLDTLSTLALLFGNTPTSHYHKNLSSRVRIVILDLIGKTGAAGVGYIPEVVSTTLSTLMGDQSYWDVANATRLYEYLDPTAAFLEDEDLVSYLLKAARLRYPYESLPFLKMVCALGSCTAQFSGESSESIIKTLVEIPGFTHLLPDKFQAYETTHEEENNNSIQLTKYIDLFVSRRKLPRNKEDISSAEQEKRVPGFRIPERTYGRMVSETNPKVAHWFYKFSGFQYFGKLLETFLKTSDELDATTGDAADRDSVTEIIALLAVIFLSLSKSEHQEEARAEALSILEKAGSSVRNRDITTVVFDIFEEELQRQSTYTGSDVPTDMLVSCVQFIHSLTTVIPARVWPLIRQSSLLESGRGSGKLSSIVSGVELVSGRYDFLLSCTELYAALIEDFVNHTVARKGKPKPIKRFGDDPEAATELSSKMFSHVILSFTRYLVDVLESSCSWKFVDLNDCRRLRHNITRTFTKILQYAYSLNNLSDDSVSATKSGTNKSNLLMLNTSERKGETPDLLEAIQPSAHHILETFLSTSAGFLRLRPLLQAYYDGYNTTESSYYVNETRLCVAQVTEALSFADALLRVGSLLNKPPSHLESQLFKASPLVARLFACNDAYRIPVLNLFEALIIAASNSTAEPPSLLGHLGSWTSKNFLHVLSDLDKPLSREDHCSAILQFVSKIVSGRQQWSANYLLTGRTPQATLKSKNPTDNIAPLDKPLLNTTLEPSADIVSLMLNHGLENLQFVALAHNFWPWATSTSPKYTAFIESITEFAGRLKPLQPFMTVDEDPVTPSYQTRVAAYIAEILAMHFFHLRQLGQPPPSKVLLENLSYFTRFAVTPPNYNSSLHANLKRNFKAQYGCQLLDFQKSSLETPRLGPSYFYDLDLADKMLSFDKAWQRRGGFRAEFIIANLNLSLVDAQIALLQSWKLLAIELSTDLTSVDLQRILAKTALDCLESNSMSQGAEEVFNRLCQTRADLALVLTQRLIGAKSTVPEMQSLLGKTWETIRSSNLTFEIGLVSGDPLYYRTLLKILFIGLRAHSDNHSTSLNAQDNLKASHRLTQSSSVSPVALEILNRVVGNGLRDLAAFIHDNPAQSCPEDLALITGILQACLRVPGIEFSYAQIVTLFINNDSARIATTLFSWSDSLAIAGDPIYGELSMLFLVELSSIPAMAEQLGLEGVLSHIGAASITSYLRRGTVGPFADSAGIQRCYSIWVKGILPLVLNLLDAVGASIAGEVSLFLNQFTALLRQSSEAFDAPETSRTASRAQPKYITLSTCMEVHTTSLIFYILNGFRDETAGIEIPEVQWDAAAVLENVEFWLTTRTVFRERILPMSEREIILSRQKFSATGTEDPINNLEEKAVLELKGIRDVLGGRSL